MNRLLSSVAGQPNLEIVNVPYAFAAFRLGLDYLFMSVYALALAFARYVTSSLHILKFQLSSHDRFFPLI